MVRFPIFPVVRILGVALCALVLIWNVHFRGGLALVSDDRSLIFNVILRGIEGLSCYLLPRLTCEFDSIFYLLIQVHPVVMVIGLLVINGEGICIMFN